VAGRRFSSPTSIFYEEEECGLNGFVHTRKEEKSGKGDMIQHSSPLINNIISGSKTDKQTSVIIYIT
jgi:hypothetical protein